MRVGKANGEGERHRGKGSVRGGSHGKGRGRENTRRKEGKEAGQDIGNKKVHEERVTNRER